MSERPLPPLLLRYAGAGEFNTAHPRLAKVCDDALVCGELYRFERMEERSTESHNHLFACIQSTWENLPAGLAERFTTPLALRKYVLIAVGHCDSDTFTAHSRAEALRFAAFMRSGEEFVLITVTAATVTRYRARSLSMRAVGKKEFQIIKDKCLHKLSEMIDSDATTLSRNAGMAA